MLRRRDPRIEERLIGDALSEHMDRVDTGRDLWPTISDILSRPKRTQFPKIAAVVAATVVVSLLVFLAVVRPWFNSDYHFDYQYTGYLEEEIPPCQPATGSSTDPCASQDGQRLAGGEASLYIGEDEPLGVEHFVYGFGWSSAVHLVVRGTYLPNTVRCAPTGMDSRYPSYVRGDDSNSTSTLCFADIRANEYILGSGPPTLTVLVLDDGHNRYANSEAEMEEDRLRMERLLLEGGWVNIWGGSQTGGLKAERRSCFLGRPWTSQWRPGRYIPHGILNRRTTERS